MGCFKKVLSVALPVAGAYFGGPIGAAAASFADNTLINGQSPGKSLLPAALSAAGAGLSGSNGTFFSDGGSLAGTTLGDINSGITGAFSPITNAISSAGVGLSDLLSGTSLGSGLNSLSNGLGFGDVVSPAADAARTATSTAATSAAAPSSFLSGYLPSSGAGAAGGGTSGGFFDNLFGSTSGGIASDGLEVGKLYDAPGLSDLAFGDSTSLYPSTIGNTGANSMLSNSKLLSGALKLGVPSLLQKDNTGGYTALRDASLASAANYQPFLTSGTGATQSLSDLYGLNGPDAAAAATANWENTPGYNFVRDQGIKALDASAASRGMLRSGNQEQAVQNFGTGLAQQYYQQYLDNLARQQGVGVTAADGVGQGNIDAATALAALKGNRATNYNNMLASLAAFL